MEELTRVRKAEAYNGYDHQDPEAMSGKPTLVNIFDASTGDYSPDWACRVRDNATIKDQATVSRLTRGMYNETEARAIVIEEQQRGRR